jgi:hypothetical protein
MANSAPLGILALLLAAAAEGIAFPAAGQERSAVPTAAEETVVTIARQTTSVAEPLTTRPGGPHDTFSITRDTQKELHRLGCYEGEINGFWSPASRSAAQRFLDRVNARLPVDKADEVLLALLQSHHDLVCSQCPRGQALDQSGRCMPAALLKRPAPPIVTGSLVDAGDASARAGEDRAAAPQPSVPQPAEQENGGAGGQKQKPTFGSAGYWRNLIRKVDKALGLN